MCQGPGTSWRRVTAGQTQCDCGCDGGCTSSCRRRNGSKLRFNGWEGSEGEGVEQQGALAGRASIFSTTPSLTGREGQPLAVSSAPPQPSPAIPHLDQGRPSSLVHRHCPHTLQSVPHCSQRRPKSPPSLASV